MLPSAPSTHNFSLSHPLATKLINSLLCKSGRRRDIVLHWNSVAAPVERDSLAETISEFLSILMYSPISITVTKKGVDFFGAAHQPHNLTIQYAWMTNGERETVKQMIQKRDQVFERQTFYDSGYFQFNLNGGGGGGRASAESKVDDVGIWPIRHRRAAVRDFYWCVYSHPRFRAIVIPHFLVAVQKLLLSTANSDQGVDPFICALHDSLQGGIHPDALVVYESEADEKNLFLL